MLDEGLHVDNVSGVIMTRKTNSRIKYLQQLGRALSSNPNKPEPIVFDLANNYITNNIYEEIKQARKEKRIREAKEIGETLTEEDIEKELEDDEPEWIKKFKITGKIQNFLDLFEKTKEIGNISQYLINAREIKEWMEDRHTTKPPSSTSKDEKEKNLGIKLSTIRQKLIKPYKDLKTEEERKDYKKKHPQLEEVLEIVNWIDENNLSEYLINAREIKKWMQARNVTKPPSQKSRNEEEKILGYALSRIRQKLIKPYKDLKKEEERERYKNWFRVPSLGSSQRRSH